RCRPRAHLEIATTTCDPMFEPIQFPTTSLPTWPSSTFEFPQPKEPELPRSRKAGRLGALAIAVGLVRGGLAWAYWRSKQQHESRSATPGPAAPMPAPEPLWIPRTPSEIEQLLQTARGWLRLIPYADDIDLARVVWARHWYGVPFPRRSPVFERPGTAEALDLIYRIIEVVRAEELEAAANDVAAPALEPVEPTDEAAPIRETPTPGCFYRVRRDDELLGAAGIAARALCEAAIDAGRRRGWPNARAEGRAKKLSSKPRLQSAYTDLIHRSEWNARHFPELSEGALLWLPPLCERGLLDRSRSRRVRLDPRLWAEGTTKLEPPTHRGLRAARDKTVGALAA